MNKFEINKEDEGVVRVSFGWMFLSVAAIILFSVFGGFISSRLWSPPVLPLINERNQLVATTQQVVISPNTSAVETLAEVERSVVLIKQSGRQSSPFIATGTIITNDGLLVTAGKVPSSALIALDYQGNEMILELVGQDELYGLTYFRISDAVFSPLDLRSDQIPIAYKAMVVSRNAVTLLPRVQFYRINNFILPPQLMPVGVQRIVKGTVFNDGSMQGGPVVDEDGRLAGLMVNPQAGLVLPADHLKESMERVVNNRREYNPFKELGLNVNYNFVVIPKKARRQFVAEVISVAVNTPAAKSGLMKGDLITGINEDVLAWNINMASLLSEDLPITLNLQRDGKEVSLRLEENEVILP